MFNAEDDFISRVGIEEKLHREGIHFEHSVLSIELDDNVIGLFDPTQTTRGLHDPLNPDSFSLPESQISPFLVIGEPTFVAKKTREYYSPDQNEFAPRDTMLSKIRAYFLGY